MSIKIIIPTCSEDRIRLLVKEIETIRAGTYKNVHPIIVADGSLYIYAFASKHLRNVTVLLNNERIGWIRSINRVLREFYSQYYIYASDDLEFPHDCIENAMKTMLRKFPDGDGLITIGKKTRCCFGLIGHKFVERFPGHQVFCPDYRHYRSDTELFYAANQLERFAYPKKRDSQVLHHREKDETWRLARKVREEDFAVSNERKKRGYLWGIDFNLVKKNVDGRKI